MVEDIINRQSRLTRALPYGHRQSTSIDATSRPSNLEARRPDSENSNITVETPVQHPDYPIQQVVQELKTISSKVGMIIDEQKRLADEVKKLQKLFKDYEKNSFKLSDAPYQVRLYICTYRLLSYVKSFYCKQSGLLEDASKNFCRNLRRELTPEHIKVDTMINKMMVIQKIRKY